MFRVNVGSTTSRVTVEVQSNVSISELFTDNNITFDGAVIYLNGAIISRDEVDRAIGSFTFAKEDGVNLLTAIVKADGASK